MTHDATPYDALQSQLAEHPRTWLITGVAGFIGSNLLETLLDLGQRVVGLDNFSTGHRRNLEQIERTAPPAAWANFRFIEGDIRRLEDCATATRGVDYVLHQAALGSVPRSLEDPIRTNESNIDGFLNMLVAARDEGVKRFIYAASSSTYGDHEALPKVEDRIGKPLSPYAVTKYVNELYASVFARCYGVECIGLRYFNIFGPRQDPQGAYAAVIPKWIAAMIRGDLVTINGDGETSRDFCYIENAVQANLLAALATDPGAVNQVYNVAVGTRTTLNELYRLIKGNVEARWPQKHVAAPTYEGFRAGDVRHSLANIDKAATWLGYRPSHTIVQGMKECVDWYADERVSPAAAESTP